ncbi:DUF4062 domain-containing protein [Chromobacterium piscinae]|uniref:DUF4062 domain-containing protein n=1 Tax=Chromobacterium piscinae TaxID=686831 RepID=UPI001E584FBA|nr:DUF4062 domain-containing protein [Chromobacterium piscinae]MCD4505556.1 DUF4062 domain-containing protein [Chromobacterium piscinae]
MNENKYQVFISSTYSDLRLERDGIIKAILEMYHIPIGMEMFSAEDEDQWEIIRRTIDVSDYYILVLGLRYGSKTSEGISFTQKEYEYALERKIPILAFIMDESVPLPKDKRDDDLSDVKKFREVVLKNSKMAQFWDTKDGLVKSVSISLMKQIMQKPGVGWVRGDKASSNEALIIELASLSKENRELRDVINELESKIIQKKPKVDININPPVIDEKFDSYKPLAMPKKINIDEVEDGLREYVSAVEVEEYNRSIPTQSELDSYNYEMDVVYKVNNYAVPLAVKVVNNGTAKANNVYIKMLFPEDVLIFEVGRRFKKPTSPLLKNPVSVARAKAGMGLLEMQSNILMRSNLGESLLYNIGLANESVVNMPRLRMNNQRWTKLEGNELTIKIDNLLHTREANFDDEYLIVPLRRGKHNVNVGVICEEFESQENMVLELDI